MNQLELNKVYNEKNLETMRRMPDNSVDSIVTDPPYGLKFMGKKWDYEVPSVEIWKECLRVLKPGGYLLSFAGTRTQHRMCCNIEDAGFEIRDMIAWVYGSGFPKSHNIGKAVDKLQGNERDELGDYKMPDGTSRNFKEHGRSGGVITYGHNDGMERKLTKGSSEFEGWGTALKPALEPITVARKPLSEKTVALNVLKWGTGGINIDGCRVPTNGKDGGVWGSSNATVDHEGRMFNDSNNPEYRSKQHEQGRFPANLIHDGSQLVLDLFPVTQSGKDCKRKQAHETGSMSGTLNTMDREEISYGDKGSAARFFYVAKASKADRNEGLEEGLSNKHPTVKPTKLMRYLVRLVTPVGGTVYDPYAGSGSTGKGCKLEGFPFIGSELGEGYCQIANQRIK